MKYSKKVEIKKERVTHAYLTLISKWWHHFFQRPKNRSCLSHNLLLMSANVTSSEDALFGQNEAVFVEQYHLISQYSFEWTLYLNILVTIIRC